MLTSFPSLRPVSLKASAPALSASKPLQAAPSISTMTEQPSIPSLAFKANHLVRFGSAEAADPVKLLVKDLIQKADQGTDWKKSTLYADPTLCYTSYGSEISCTIGDTRYKLRHIWGEESKALGFEKGNFLTVSPAQGAPQTHAVEWEDYKDLSLALRNAGNPKMALEAFAEWDRQLPQANQWQVRDYQDDSGREINCIIDGKQYGLNYSQSGNMGYGHHSVYVEFPANSHCRVEYPITEEQYNAKLEQYLNVAKTRFQENAELGANLDTSAILLSYLNKLEDRSSHYFNHHKGSVTLGETPGLSLDDNAQSLFLHTFAWKPEKADKVHIMVCSPGKPTQSFYLSNPVELAVAKAIVAHGKLKDDEQDFRFKEVFQKVSTEQDFPLNEFGQQLIASLPAEKELLTQAKAAKAELFADVKTLSEAPNASGEENAALLARIDQNLKIINNVKIATPYRDKSD